MSLHLSMNGGEILNLPGGDAREAKKRHIDNERPRTDGEDPCQVAMMGFGNFGGGIAETIAKNMIGSRVNFNPIHVYVRSHPESAASSINQSRQTKYLPGIELHRALHATSDMSEAVRGKSQILLAIPSGKLLEFLETFADVFAEAFQKGDIPPNVAVTSLIKGLPDVIDSTSSIVDEGLRQVSQQRLIMPTELIGYALQQRGVRLGGSDGVRMMCMHGAAFGTDIARGAPYSLTIGTDSTSPEMRAEQLAKIMVKSKAAIEIALGQEKLVELGAIGKNFIALLANFVSGYCMDNSYSHQGALVRAKENGIYELSLLAQYMFNTRQPINPIGAFQAQREDLELSLFAAATPTPEKKMTPGRNAEFGVRLASAGSIDDVLAEMSASRGSEVTVEGIGIVCALFNFLQHKGWLDHFPLVHGLAICLALRDPNSSIPEIRRMDPAGIDSYRKEADRHLYKLAVSGEHISSFSFTK